MATSPPSSKVVPGTILAERYRIEREIGRGGMASVYEATHKDIGKQVAVKVLSEEFASSSTVVERFLREARAAASVQSPYICDVYDSGRLKDGRPFLVLELLHGQSLYERMVKIRQFDTRSTLRIITHVARGLAKAHGAKIVHRDLKPENIFVTKNEDGELHSKILDFGLAKFYAPVGGGKAEARLTREGAIFGTPAYMSPEQIRGQGEVDSRADLWALGCITYECFTGRTVWSTDQGVAMTFAQIASASLPKLSKYRPDLPPAMDRWFEKALSRNIATRFQTAKELADSLSQALQQGPPSIVATELMGGDELIPVPSSEMPPAVDAPPPASAPKSTQSDGLGEAASGGRAGPQPSLADMGSSNTVKGSRPNLGSDRGRKKIALGLGAALAAGAIGVAAWQASIRSGRQAGPNPTTSASAAGSASAAPTASSLAPSTTASDAPAWMKEIRSGQARAAKGNWEEAQKTFRKAFDMSGSAAARTLRDHAKIAATSNNPCQVRGLARLRPLKITSGQVRRPQLVRGKTNFLAIWGDDHEATNHTHAYTQRLDDALRPQGRPVDVTPEATRMLGFLAVPFKAGFSLAYSESGSKSHSHSVRTLTGAGRISSPGQPYSAARTADRLPSLVFDPEGNGWAIWRQSFDGTSGDLVLQKVSPKLGKLQRLSALGSSLPRGSIEDVHAASSKAGLEVVFQLQRGVNRTIHLMHLPWAGLAGKQLIVPTPPPKADLFLEKPSKISADERGATPFIGCLNATCFAAWHVEGTGTGRGAMLASIDGSRGQMLWRKQFAQKGGRPSLAFNSSGKARLAWFEKGRLRTAPLDADGLGESQSVAQVVADQLRPAISPGNGANDWLLAWLSFEAGHREPYGVRLSCP